MTTSTSRSRSSWGAHAPGHWRSAGRCCSASAGRRKVDAAIDEAIQLAEVEDQETLGWAHMFAAAVHFSGWRDDRRRGRPPCPEASSRSPSAWAMPSPDPGPASGSATRHYVAGDAERAVDEFTRALTEIDERGAGRGGHLPDQSWPGARSGGRRRGRPGHRGRSRSDPDGGGRGFDPLRDVGPRSRSAASLLERGSEADVEEAAEQLRLALDDRPAHGPRALHRAHQPAPRAHPHDGLIRPSASPDPSPASGRRSRGTRRQPACRRPRYAPRTAAIGDAGVRGDHDRAG